MAKNYPVVEYGKNTLKPVLEKKDGGKKPVIGQINKENSWSFSFKYFEQIRYFGLGDADTNWFIALIDRLKDLSSQKVDYLLSNYTARDAYRFHPIDWAAKNIPMQRKDFSWIDRNILENEDEYPFLQFQVSTALGRVVGFFDENHKHFYVVLLDHKHNIQPSKKNNYTVNDTTILYCDYSSFLMDIDKIKGLKCPVDECRCKDEIKQIPTKAGRGKFIYFNIDDEYYEELMKLTEDKSLKQIIENGILASI
jgi:hypothetical protein